MLIDLCQSITGFGAMGLNFLSAFLSFLLVTFSFFDFLELSTIGPDCIKTCEVISQEAKITTHYLLIFGDDKSNLKY